MKWIVRSRFARPTGSDVGRALTLAAVGAALLLPLLWQPLWRDEGSTFIDVSQPTVAGVLDSMRVNELSPPLYFLLEHFWIRLVGTTEFALRLPSLIAIAFSISLLYDAARRVRSRIAGYATAACAALAPISLFVGSDARPYSMTLFFQALAMWLIAQLLVSPLANPYPIALGLAATTAAFCWVNYTAWPVVIAMLLVTPAIWWSGGPRRALLLFLALVVGAATTLPMLANFVAAAAHVRVEVGGPMSNNLHKIDSGLRWLSPLAAIQWALTSVLVGGTIAWVTRLRPLSRRLVFAAEDQLLIVCFSVTFFGAAASLRPSIYGYHLAAYAPAMWLILGNYYARLVTWLDIRGALRAPSWPRKLRFLALATTTALTFAGFPVLYLFELSPRSGSSALAHELERLTVGNVVMIAVPDTISPSLYYYLRNDSRITVRGIATWSRPWYYYYTQGWDKPSLKKHFLNLIDDAATHHGLALAVDWSAPNYNGHRYDLALDAAREEVARRSVTFRHTFHGTLETMELTLLSGPSDEGRLIPKR